jgi:translation initiation factor IF-3
LALPPRRPNIRQPLRRPILKNPHRTNLEITADPIRLVGEEEGELVNGVVSLRSALDAAHQRGVDLVEIAPGADPPVCRIIEYSKFRYEQKKKEKEAKAKQHVVEVKEIRFGPNTDDHDFNFKLKHAQSFLDEGNKIKAYVVFHGRSIVHKERGEKLLREFATALADKAKIEMEPRLEGKRMFLIMTPSKKI